MRNMQYTHHIITHNRIPTTQSCTPTYKHTHTHTHRSLENHSIDASPEGLRTRGSLNLRKLLLTRWDDFHDLAQGVGHPGQQVIVHLEDILGTYIQDILGTLVTY
jgi:hypothetical protein